MQNITSNFKAIYDKKQMGMVKFGLVIAFVGAMFNSVLQNFNVAATSIIEGDFTGSLLSGFFMSIMTLGICELLGGIFTIIWNTIRGLPLAEIPRNWRVKSGRMIIVASLIATPIATAFSVVAISLCGSTYANCIIGLAPAVAAIMGVLVLHEKISKRAWVGIIVSILGATIATIGHPENVEHFMLGILIAIICPIAFATEAIIGTHGVDVTDPTFSCPMYRLSASGIMAILIAIIVALITGHASWIGLLFSLILANPKCMLFMLCTSLAMMIQYNTAYQSYNYVGASKSQAILWSGTFWTVPVGFLMSAMHVLPYHVTGIGIVGAIFVVIGITLVVGKPSELFNLRSN